MTRAQQNWADSTRWQSDFYGRAGKRRRVDAEFEWGWIETAEKRGLGGSVRQLVKQAIRRLPIRTRWHGPPYSAEWIGSNAQRLWEARAVLADDLSKLFFDMLLVLRSTSSQQHYFPRVDFEDFVEVMSVKPFDADGLPNDYVGLPLRVFELNVLGRSTSPALKVISTDLQVGLVNRYRQYLTSRGDVSFAPAVGDTVLDCGACIGDISLLFAQLAGPAGSVHLFDPVPLHARYCELQRHLNPALADAVNINVLAVGETTQAARRPQGNSDRISPSGLAIDSFSTTSIDDYVARKQLRRVDVIKMDIEGAEVQALAGAAGVVREFRPTLTISAYHRDDDLWTIPEKIKSLNSDYKLYFGHHSPIQWESVYYAVQPR